MTFERRRLSEENGIKRRELLKSTGLAAFADLGALTETVEGPDGIDRNDQSFRAFLDRLPNPPKTPAGRYEATYTRRLDEDALPEPALLADAEAHIGVISSRSLLTVGLGVSSKSEMVEILEGLGYQRAESVERQPLFLRRGRYKQRVVIPGDDFVVVGRGPRLEPVVSLAHKVGSTHEEPLDERMPRVKSVIDRLGRGPVMSVSPTGLPRHSDDQISRPVATGERLEFQSQSARLRTVDVYSSRAASVAALTDVERPNSIGSRRIFRDGRAVVSDMPVHDKDLQILKNVG